MLGHGTTSNRYEILARLATGGMAELFLARGTAVGDVVRYVVLKRVLPAFGNLAQYGAMFLDEARIAAQFRHPNIVQLYDVGRLGSSHFYTMEYVHGETVAALLQHVHASGRPVPVQHVLAIAAGVSAGLHHAHTRVGPDGRPLGIVHRDVSPANIMIGFDGVVKLLDFGVAKALGRVTETLAGVLKGKVGYLSPEQCKGTSIDARSDLFSLGICMFEMLTLHYLFYRSNDLATIDAIMHEPVASPSTLRPKLQREVDALVATALAKEPHDRFADADAMHEAIERVAEQCGYSISQSSLGRYMRELFGARAEPWLDPSLSPIEVTGEVIDEIDPTVPIPLEPEGAVLGRDSIDMDKLIEAVHEMKLARQKVVEPDTIQDPTARETALPRASSNPAWESTLRVPHRAIPNLDATARVAPEDFPSHVETLLDPRIVAHAVTRTATPRAMPVPVSTPPRPASPPVTPLPVTPQPARGAYVWPRRRRAWWRRRQTRHIALAVAAVVALVVVLWKLWIVTYRGPQSASRADAGRSNVEPGTPPGTPRSK